MIDHERVNRLAKELYALGVSKKGVAGLLAIFPLDQIEDQLKYLPYRTAKRPEAMIVEAIRNNYSPPNTYYYAAHKAQSLGNRETLDEDTKLSLGVPSTESEGHRTQNPPGDTPLHLGIQSAPEASDPFLQNPDGKDWQGQ